MEGEDGDFSFMHVAFLGLEDLHAEIYSRLWQGSLELLRVIWLEMWESLA